MAIQHPEFAVWSPSSEAGWFDKWAGFEEGSEPGMTSTDIVCDRMELFGSPFREPSVPRHRPATAIVYGFEMAQAVRLSEKATKVLDTPAKSRKELKALLKAEKVSQTLAERCLRQLHFASQITEPFDRKAFQALHPRRFAVTA